MKDFFTGLGKFMVLVVLDIPVLVFAGYVFSQLWLWFVVPLGVSPIGISHAIGLGVVFTFLTRRIKKEDPDEEVEGWFWQGISALFQSFLAALVAWGLGAIIHAFM